jgi:hypothetical protein
MDSDNVLVWNVRGLNGWARHDDVRSLVAAERPSVVCIQETKLVVISDFDIIQILGLNFGYTYLPVVHSEGVYWLFGELRVGLETVLDNSWRCSKCSKCIRILSNYIEMTH